jgi:hypothetical protein
VKGLSVNLRELPLADIPTDIQGLQPIMAIICTSGDFIVYLCFYDPKPTQFGFVQSEFVDDCPSDVPIIGPYVRVLLDMLHKRVLSAVELPREPLCICYRFQQGNYFLVQSSTRSITLVIYDIAYVLLLFDWHLFLSLLEEGSLAC